MTNYFGRALALAAAAQRAIPRDHDKVYASDASVELQVGDETEIHGSCLRKQYYRITETEQSDPEEIIERFVAQVGEAVHTQVGEVFRLAKQLDQEESRLKIPEVKLSGRLDLIIEVDGKKIGVEIKTVSGYYGTQGCIKPTTKKPFYPRYYHLAQTVVYAEHHKAEFTDWIILYIDRDTGAFAEHHIEYVGHDHIRVNGEPTSITPKAVYDRWRRLWEFVNAKQLPPQDFERRYSKERIERMGQKSLLNKDQTARWKAGRKVDMGDKQCREWCQWRTRCWTEDKDA